MLVLKRKEGQWVEITHKSGDVLRIRSYRIREGFPSQLDMAFDDPERNFEIQRPERKLRMMDGDTGAGEGGGCEIEAEARADDDGMPGAA